MVEVEGGDKRWISGLQEGRMWIVERTESRHVSVYSGFAAECWKVDKYSDARMHSMADRVLASNAILDSRLTECHGCWHVILWECSMHLPIRMSGIVRFCSWIEWAGEAFLEGSMVRKLLLAFRVGHHRLGQYNSSAILSTFCTMSKPQTTTTELLLIRKVTAEC